MNFTLALFSWIALSYLYSSRLRFNIYETWAVSLSTLIIISFFITLIINLETVIYVKFLLMMLGAAEYYKNLNTKDNSAKGLIFVGVLFIFVSYLITRHESYMYIFNWDDFSHWARTVKLLILDNGYGDKYFNNVLFPKYGPGSATWHAFFQHSSSIKESTLYFTQLIWIISLLLCIYGVLLQYTVSLFQKVMSLIVLIGLGNTMTPSGHNLQVDILIGLSFAVTYLLYNYSNHPLLQKIISSAIIFCTIVLTKPIGFVVAFQFFIINLLTNRFKRKEIFANAVILILSIIGIIVWRLFIPESLDWNTTSSSEGGARSHDLFQKIMWQSGVFYDFFVIKFFDFSGIEKSHVVIYGSLLYSLVIYFKSRSIRLFKIVFIALSTYMIFLLFAYAYYFNAGGGNLTESLTLQSMNRYISVQFYFLIPLMLIETLKLQLSKNGYFLVLLVILTSSYYFTKLFAIFPIMAVVALIFSKYPLMVISKKIIATVILFSTVSFYYSYDIILSKIIPSSEYMKGAASLKRIGKSLLEDGKTIVIWNGYDTYSGLGIQYYSDYQDTDYKVITTSEYKSKIITNHYKSPNYERQLFFNND